MSGCWTAPCKCAGDRRGCRARHVGGGAAVSELTARVGAIEDQSHISLFMAASPDASLEATNKASLQVVKAVTSFPEAKFMWSLTANWGGFADGREKLEGTEADHGADVRSVVLRGVAGAGLQVFPASTPRYRRPASTTWS